MIRTLLLLFCVLLHCRQASAHFLFVHVVRGSEPRVEMHFSESAWDFSANAGMVGLMTPARVWCPDGTELTMSSRPHALITELPEGRSEDDRAAPFTIRLGDVSISDG